MSNQGRGNKSQHTFAQVPKADIPRSSFDRSHGHKTTFDEGFLIPIFVDEALPGDTFNLSMTGFGRLATPIHPVMDNMYCDTQFFAVPIRLLWDNWARFNGEQTIPDASTDFLVPQVVSPVGGYPIGSLADYFGIPTGVAGLSHSAFWHRAYSLIWNEWYRDENLQDPLTVVTDDGPDDPAIYELRRRGKRHDYFTSSLPWPQKGEAVSMPLGISAPVSGSLTQPQHILNHWNVNLAADAPVNLDAALGLYQSTGGTVADQMAVNFPGYTDAFTATADLSTATAATINQLRQAFQVQKLLERDARGGTRYTEILRSHFGVVSPDARLQRPEFLGGGTSTVNVSPVPQTSSTDATTPQGNLSGFGTVTLNGHGFTKSFTEHCVIIGLASVRADLTYQQGLNRMWSRQTRYDFYWPSLSQIGEQSVLQKEIYADGTVDDDIVFGYQERYAEYRYKPSLVTGLFRSSAAGTLDSWHLAQNFAMAPILDEAFIVEYAPVDRVIAVPSEPHFILDMFFRLNCARPMPVYGVPGFIDHF